MDMAAEGMGEDTCSRGRHRGIIRRRDTHSMGAHRQCSLEGDRCISRAIHSRDIRSRDILRAVATSSMANTTTMDFSGGFLITIGHLQ